MLRGMLPDSLQTEFWVLLWNIFHRVSPVVGGHALAKLRLGQKQNTDLLSLPTESLLDQGQDQNSVLIFVGSE